MSKKSTLYIFSFTLFLTISLGQTQLIPYLKHYGYTLSERGYILAASAFVAILAQVLLGYLCDRTKKIKPFFIIAYLTFIVFAGMMFLSSYSSFFYHLLVVAIMSGFMKAVIALNETWMLEINQSNYGKIRGFGAIGLCVGSAITGILIIDLDYSKLLYSLIAISIIVFIYAFKSHDIHRNKRRMLMREEAMGLIKNKSYILLLIIFLMIFMIGTADQYVVIDKMLILHASKTQIGLKWAVQSLMEVPILLFADKILKHFKLVNLLYIGIVMYALKFFLYASFNHPIGIIIASSFQIVTLPLIMLTSKLLIMETTNVNINASAQMIGMSFFIGGSGLITPLITAFLANNIGINKTLYLVSAFSIIPLLLTWGFQKRRIKDCKNILT